MKREIIPREKSPAKIFREVLHEIHLLLLGIIAASFAVFYFVLFIPALIIRPAVTLYARKYRPDLGKILPCTGNMFVQVDDAEYQKSVVTVQVTVDGIMSPEIAAETFEEKLLNKKLPNGDLKYPQLQQYITNFCGLKFWAWEKPFCPYNHIKVLEHKSLEELNDFRSELASSPFEIDKSPWEFYILPGETLKEGKASTLMFLKFHHGLADGYSLLFMFQQMFSTAKPPAPIIKPKFASPTLMYFVRIPYLILRSLGELLYNGTSQFLWKINEGKKSKKYYLRIGKGIPTTHVKRICRMYGVSFSSVVYSIWTGGVSAFLSKKKDSIKVPESLPCITLLPVPGHPDALENKFSFALTPLPIEERDRLQRLKYISDLFESIRNSPIPIISYWICLLHGCNFNFIGKIVNSYKYASIICSYFPITDDLGSADWNVNGHELIDISFFVKIHQGDAGMVIAISSYRGQLHFTPVVNSSILCQKEVDELSCCVDEEIQMLLKSTQCEKEENDNSKDVD